MIPATKATTSIPIMNAIALKPPNNTIIKIPHTATPSCIVFLFYAGLSPRWLDYITFLDNTF